MALAFVCQCSNAGINVLKINTLEALFESGVCLLKLEDTVLEALQQSLDIGIGENIHRLSEASSSFEIINDASAELVRLDRIHPGDYLQKGVLGEFASQVHDPTDGGPNPAKSILLKMRIEGVCLLIAFLKFSTSGM